MPSQSQADREYWKTWSGKPANAAERGQAIECFRRLTAGQDPDGEWDLCRLMLAKLLSERAGFGLIIGWAQPIATGPGWVDAQTALDLFTTTAGSKTLTDDRRRQARIARARLATGMAILRGANALAGGRRPDLPTVRTAAAELPADDPYAPMVPIATETIEELTTRREESPEEFRAAVDELTAPPPGPGGRAPGRGLTETVLAILTSINSAINPRAVPAGPLAELARTGLAQESRTDAEAGVYHALSFLARYSAAAAAGEPVTDQRALTDLDEVRSLLPAGHPLRQMLPAFTYQLLADRFDRAGALIDRDAAQAYQRAITELDQWQRWLAGNGPATGALRSLAADASPAVIGGLTALDAAIEALSRRDQPEADTAIASTRRHLDDLPAGSRWQPVIAAGLGECEATRAGLTVNPDDAQAGLRELRLIPDEPADGLEGERRARVRSAAGQEAVAGLERVIEAARRAGPAGPYHGHQLAERGARAQAALSLLTGDLHHLDAALAGLRAATGSPGDRPAGNDRAGQLLLLGQLLLGRHRLDGDRTSLDDAIAVLRQARWLLIDRPGPARTRVLRDLAMAFWLRADGELGDQTQAIETGLVALEERAADVLLQSGAARGIEAARSGSADSAVIAAWCLAEGRPDAAVQALELGRALVLHTTTVSADIPGLLGELGREDLAESWRQELANAGPFPWDGAPGGEDGPPGGEDSVPGGEDGPLLPRLFASGLSVPADVRRQVLDVLRAGPAAAHLLTRPAIGELTSGLAAAGYDAFVYLLPPGPRRAGCALIVSASGLDQVPLPDLADGPVDAWPAALATRIATGDVESALSWPAALETACDWAWTAVVDPILRQAESWRLRRPPRLVLIPAGNLGGIPWHAARMIRPDGSPHYAIEDAVFSYAASARQLVSASQRPRRPWRESPVILANPTGDLKLATAEADELRRRWYPDAVCLGRFSLSASPVAGPGTPGEVLARLPGGTRPAASLLHFGCHATVARSLAESQLWLAGPAELTVARIVAQAAGRGQGSAGDSPGFLAVLAACMSDLTDIDHDEALTLASALLASGACGVVGARWPVYDWATSQLMLMFHHYLITESLGPAQALRAAQLWMIDPDRRQLPGLDDKLTGRARDRRRLAEIGSWAAFTYQGVFGL